MLTVDYKSNNLNVNFMNKTVSWCKTLEAPRYEPLIKIAYKVFSRKSHLPQKCPMEKNHLYYIPNFIFQSDEFPPILPETKINVYIEFWDNVKDDLVKVATMAITGQITRF